VLDRERTHILTLVIGGDSARLSGYACEGSEDSRRSDIAITHRRVAMASRNAMSYDGCGVLVACTGERRMNNHPTSYLSLDDDALLRDCDVDKYRASGPGGQKRNKTDSAVRIRHLPTGVAAVANEDRSQHVNKRRALRRLRLLLALQERRQINLADYEPSKKLASYMTPARTLRISDRNDDYPMVVAEVMKVMVACAWRISDAAHALGMTTGQLGEFVRRDPTLLREVNRLRVTVELKPLR